MSLPVQVCIRIAMVSMVLGAAVRVSSPARGRDATKIIPPSLITTASFVWHDNNRNGVFDDGESPLTGVTVQIFAAGQTTELASAVTDEKGRAEVRVLHHPGHFQMKFLAPPGYFFTVQTRTEGIAVGNDADAEGFTAPFFNRSFRNDVDAGLVRVYAFHRSAEAAALPLQ